MKGKVRAVIGAQFGSEGKGMVVEKIASQHNIHIRTGAPNAGHTYYIWDREGVVSRRKVVARSVPCGAANPNAQLLIGPGGLVDVDLLIEEVRALNSLDLGVSDRIMVDAQAMAIDPVRHHEHEGGVDGEAHRLIGSTGEGVGPARMARVSRGTFRKAGASPAWSVIDQVSAFREQLEAEGIAVGDTAKLANTAWDAGASILLEGTQGSGLSLIHGPWPYVTSSDTNAAQLCVDAGLSPMLLNGVTLVVRSVPIRVAGNSGPLPLETSWPEIGQPEEQTTVTKKVRRVGRFYAPTVRRAVMLNRPDVVVLTFADYMWPDLYGKDSMPSPAPDGFVEWLYGLQSDIGAGVTDLGTGPDSMIPLGMHHSVPVRGPWPSFDTAFGLRGEVLA